MSERLKKIRPDYDTADKRTSEYLRKSMNDLSAGICNAGNFSHGSTEDITKNDLYRKYAQYVELHNLEVVPPPSLLAAHLADVNLQIRGLVGLVLGSNAKRLYSPGKNISRANRDSDLDVLILNLFSANRPGPQEWGIDWFVRPTIDEQANLRQTPTNGFVNLWYDIELNEEVAGFGDKSGKIEKLSPLFLDEEMKNLRFDENAVVETIFAVRNNLKTIIEPGLYLPDSFMMESIVKNAEKKAAKSRDELKSLRRELQKIEKIVKEKNIGLELMMSLKNSYDRPALKQRINLFNFYKSDDDFADKILNFFDRILYLIRKYSNAREYDLLNPEKLISKSGLRESDSLDAYCRQVNDFLATWFDHFYQPKILGKTDYSYLLYYPPKLRGGKPLFPVLESNLLIFTPAA